MALGKFYRPWFVKSGRPENNAFTPEERREVLEACRRFKAQDERLASLESWANALRSLAQSLNERSVRQDDREAELREFSENMATRLDRLSGRLEELERSGPAAGINVSFFSKHLEDLRSEWDAFRATMAGWANAPRRDGERMGRPFGVRAAASAAAGGPRDAL